MLLQPESLLECAFVKENIAMTTPEQQKNNQRKSNVRMGLILASVALVFFIGFMAKMIYLAK